MHRRTLFGFVAALPVCLASAAKAKADQDDAPTSELMRLKQGAQPIKMELLGPAQWEPQREVSLAIGRDGMLWVKTGDNWNRVATD